MNEFQYKDEVKIKITKILSFSECELFIYPKEGSPVFAKKTIQFINNLPQIEYNQKLYSLAYPTKPKTCQVCKGRGSIPHQYREADFCWECEGKGKIG